MALDRADRTTEKLRKNAEHVLDRFAAGGADADCRAVRVRGNELVVLRDDFDAAGGDAGDAEAVAARVERAHAALGAGERADAADVGGAAEDLLLLVEQGLALVEEDAVLVEEQLHVDLRLLALEVECVEVVGGGHGDLERAGVLGEVVGEDLFVEGVATAVEVELLLGGVALVAVDARVVVEHGDGEAGVLVLGEELELELVALALHAGLVAQGGVLVGGLAERGPGVELGGVEIGHVELGHLCLCGHVLACCV